MLSKKEIRERAHYCCSVFLQLSWLYSNDFIEPIQYLDSLKNSSLGLGDDEFITQSIKEALLAGQQDGGLRSLIALYEGFTAAFCEVLETGMDDIKAGFSPQYQKKLASEVGIDLKF